MRSVSLLGGHFSNAKREEVKEGVKQRSEKEALQ